MKPRTLFSMVMLVSVLISGVTTTAQAGVPEDLTAFKAAASELKTCMVSIINEATAKANVGTLDAAVTKFNQASTTLDTSLASLDRSTQANATQYQNTLGEMQTAAQPLVAEQVRLLSAPPIAAVVAPKLDAIRH